MGSPVLSYNNVWNNFQGPYTGISAGTGDINLDPQFTDRLSGDFSLLATSPSINTGNPNLYDLDCSRSDMGADGGPY